MVWEHETWIPKPTNQSKLILHRWDGRRWIPTVFVRFVPLASALLLLAAVLPAPAHDAASGWSYPESCCGGQDCREVEATERGDAYVFHAAGRDFTVRKEVASPSGDTEFHVCIGTNENGPFIRCFFAPGNS